MGDDRKELYLKEREFFTNSLTQGSLFFDKTILTLSSGAFAISITFIKDIVPVAAGNTKWMLVVAWAMFSLSILLTLGSFLSSQKNCLTKIEIIDKAFNEGQLSDLPNEVDYITLYLNLASYVVFTIGIISIIIFSAINYHSIKELTNGDQKNSGYSESQSSIKLKPQSKTGRIKEWHYNSKGNQ